MMNISFGSTYRVNLKNHTFHKNQKPVKPAKKRQIKDFTVGLGGIAPSNSTGSVRFSVAKEKDAEVEAKLKDFGIRKYQKLDLHDLPKDKIDDAFKNNRFEFVEK